VESMRTLKNVAVKRGSITIPCLYDAQYKTNSKFWCKGYYWSSCSIVAYANTHGSTSVTDYPEQNMFTVEINPVSDSGYYWCAAEIGRNPDDGDYLYLTVREDPGLSVESGRVSGAEGGRVTVQCLYSAAYRNTQKQWCRFKDGCCKTVGMSSTSQNSSVHISDDGRSFSVEIRGLKKSDAGWYWCGAGDLQVPVHVSVGGEAPGLPKHQQDHTASGSSVMALCLIFGLLLVLVLLGWVIWKYKQNHLGLLVTDRGCNRSLGLKKPRENAVTYGSGVDRQCTASSASEPDVTYSTVKISPHPS
ncbi:CMRF35-like molecule 1, partial [Clarias magur]